MNRVDYSRLHKACKAGNLNEVKLLLSQTAYQFEINAINGLYGYSPLHEAVLARNPEIIKELLRFDANINVKAHDGHTPLHIAASRNYCECISVLLSHGANINQLDSFGRTPCRIAEIYFCNNASRLLRSEEIYSILRHPLSSKAQVSSYLKDVKLNNVEDNFFQKCLDIVVENDNYAAVQVILSLKNQSIKECLEKAFRRPQCSKTLLMVFLFYIVLKKFNDVLKFLIDPGTTDLKKKLGSLDIEVSVEKLIEMRLFIEEIKGDLNFYVSLACSENVKNYEAVKVLLKKYHYDKDLQVASWSKLNLSCLKAEWFQEITILNLNLHDNAIKNFPSSITNYLNIVKILDLSKNKLKAIPPELLMLPKLQTLLLSSNQLQQLPDVKKWSPDLEKLSLNDNNLKSFPDNVDGLFVKHINIADNQLKFIPESICKLKHLFTLDISRNSGIHQIPAAIGKMETLDNLIIRGLTIKDPPLDYLNNVSTSHIKNFLIARSRSSVPYYIMKLMIIGFSKQGKTTLLHRLQNKTEYNEDICTTGIDIQNITITRPSKPTYNFRAWDFAGQEEYYITHQCFMSGSSLYLLLWDINEKLNGVKMLKVWLESLFARSIHFSLIIVATKVDLLQDDLKSVKDEMKSEIYNLFQSTPAFKKNHYLMDKFALMFLSLNPKYESYAKDMSDLKSKIYEVASKMKCENSDENFMGRLVPESYMKLDSKIEEKRKTYTENDIPILNKEDILEIAKSLSCKGDEFTESDIDTAALFLHTTGTILYYNTTYGGLKNMYFICPSWVCKLMSKLITEDRVHNFITNGILQKSHIPLILENNLCGETSVIVNTYLRLLSVFQIAIEIDDHRVFVPSKLPSDAPLYSVNDSGPLLKRYHFFPWIPFGFWPRFTSRFLALIKEMLLPHTLEYFEDSEELGYFFDKDVIKCWRKGLIFDHPNVYFSIQEIESKKEGMDTIETCVQHSPVGYRVLSYIVDQIRTVILEWFQGVLYFADKMQIESYFECPTCTFLGIEPPVLFNINYAFQRVYQTIEEKTFSIPCEYNHSPRVINLEDCCPDLTFRDLTDDLRLRGSDVIYAKTDKIAGGHCGNVYRGNFKNEVVAIKCYKFAMTNEVIPSLEKFYEFRQEVLMINKLYHPCIIKFKGVSFKPELCVMLEYAEHGSLATVIHGANSVVISRLVRLRICQQIASALLFMHKHNIVHRDIKSDNILVFSLSLNAKVNIKLTDFDTACYMSWCGLKSITGTKGYIAPEIISSKSYLDNYTFSIDVYSFSNVMYELITYRRPFYQVQHSNEINNYVRKGLRPIFYDVHYAFYGLINLTKLMTMMWHQEASERPNTKDIINQLGSPAFQLIFGMEKLQGCSPGELCYIHTTDELWVSCDKSESFISIFKLALVGNNSQIENMANEEKIEIDVKKLIQNKFYVTSMVVIGDGSHLCVVLRSNYDLILVYEVKTRKVLIRFLMKEAIVDSICYINDWMFLGCRSNLSDDVEQPLFYKVNIRELINNNSFSLLNVELNFQENQVLAVIAASSNVLLKSVGQCISYERFDICQQGIKAYHRTQNVRNIIFSSDEKYFFISFQCSTEIFVGDANIDAQSEFTKYDCRNDIEKCTPSVILLDLRVSCMCSVYNTLWIGTGSGHILIYEVSKPLTQFILLLALHPYKTEMRRFAVIHCPKREDNVEYLVATIGRELNEDAFGNNSIFKCGETPVDETAKAQKRQLFRIDKKVEKKEKVILIWQALMADQYKDLLWDF